MCSGNNFRVTINLSNFFHDYRHRARIFIHDDIQTIRDLESRIETIFNIKNFHLTSQNDYLPPSEDVKILQRDEIIWVIQNHNDDLTSTVHIPTVSNFTENFNTKKKTRKRSLSVTEQDAEYPKKKKKKKNNVEDKNEENVINSSPPMEEPKKKKKRVLSDSTIEKDNGKVSIKKDEIEAASKHKTKTKKSTLKETKLSENLSKENGTLKINTTLPIPQDHNTKNNEKKKGIKATSMTYLESSSSSMTEDNDLESDNKKREKYKCQGNLSSYKRNISLPTITDKYLQQKKVNIVKIEYLAGGPSQIKELELMNNTEVTEVENETIFIADFKTENNNRAFKRESTELKKANRQICKREKHTDPGTSFEDGNIGEVPEQEIMDISLEKRDANTVDINDSKYTHILDVDVGIEKKANSKGDKQLISENTKTSSLESKTMETCCSKNINKSISDKKMGTTDKNNFNDGKTTELTNIAENPSNQVDSEQEEFNETFEKNSYNDNRIYKNNSLSENNVTINSQDVSVDQTAPMDITGMITDIKDKFENLSDKQETSLLFPANVTTERYVITEDISNNGLNNENVMDETLNVCAQIDLIDNATKICDSSASLSSREKRRKLTGIGYILEQLRKNEPFVNADMDNDHFDFVTKRQRKRVRRKRKKNTNKDVSLNNSSITVTPVATPLPMKSKACPVMHLKFEEDNDECLKVLDVSKKDHSEKEDSNMDISSVENITIESDVDDAVFKFDEDEILKSPLIKNLLPKIKDIIAFKILRITDNYTPEISSYVIGLVKEFSAEYKVVHFEILYGLDQCDEPRGRLSIGEADEQVKSNEREFIWSEIINPRLLYP